MEENIKNYHAPLDEVPTDEEIEEQLRFDMEWENYVEYRYLINHGICPIQYYSEKHKNRSSEED